MWTTLLVMALAVSLEPFRIGMTVLFLGRPRPARQLSALMCGGFTAGLTVGVVVLFALRPAAMSSDHFTLPRVQLAIGTTALLVAAALVVHTLLRRRYPAATTPVVDGVWRARVRRLLVGRSLWVAWGAGVGTALPSVDYLAALTVILASGASAGTQVAALVAFNVVALSLIELPLVAYLVAPDRTRGAMTALNGWLRSRRHRDVVILLTTCGVILILFGLLGSGGQL
jgi:hypothetical protein